MSKELNINIKKLQERKTEIVKLGDLINELSTLTGIKTSNIGIDIYSAITFNGKYNIEEITEMIEQRTKRGYDGFWLLRLYSNKDENSYDKQEQLFCYGMMFNVNLNDIQADGKTFLEHCTATTRIRDDFFKTEFYTTLDIDKNIDDLVLNIPQNQLVRNSSTIWYPVDLMTQAVINCVEKTSKKEASQGTGNSRSRKLSDETNK